MAKKHGLVFGESCDEQGFRNSKTSISRFPDPSIITRELIQNALDANETGKVEVSFKLDSIPLQALPGLKEYEQAFEAAKKVKHPGDDDVISKIEDQLAQETITVLWVTDNGEGLDTGNMRRLLADGGSDKIGKAGSYGLGHLSTFPASDLNYVIYGGCSKKEQILSGQCILASHYKGEAMYSPNGYISVGESVKDPRKREFPKIDEIEEDLWGNKLKQIKKNGTGSFVCITAFNNFGLKKADFASVEEEIKYAAASHFMPAIYEGKMEVTVGEETLNSKQALHRVIATRKKETYKRRGALYGAAGSRFYNLYMCMERREEDFPVPSLPNESVRVLMDLAPADGKRNIHLFRHGMWITNSIPGFDSADFSGHKPFTAVILVEKGKAERTGALVAKAEGERHMQIRKDALNKEDEAALTSILREVKKKIKEKAEEIDKQGELLDFIDIGLDDFAIKERDESRAPSRPRRKGAKRIVPRKPIEVHQKKKGDDDPDNKPRYVRKAHSLPIPCTVPAAEGEILRFVARPEKDYSNVEVRIVARSGSDQSCALPLPDQFVYLAQESKQNGADVPADDHIPEFAGDKKNYVAVKLGSVSKGELEMMLKPAATPPPPGRAYVVEFVSRKGGQ